MVGSNDSLAPQEDVEWSLSYNQQGQGFRWDKKECTELSNAGFPDKASGARSGNKPRASDSWATMMQAPLQALLPQLSSPLLGCLLPRDFRPYLGFQLPFPG